MSSYILDILGKLRKQMFTDFTHSLFFTPPNAHTKKWIDVDHCLSSILEKMSPMLNHCCF